MICINTIINPADLASINSLIDDKNNQDGILTAGKTARKVKNNIQQFSGDALGFAEKIIRQAFDNSVIIQNYVFPKAYTKMRLIRYQNGMYYGKHVDNVVQNNIRTDISFSVFLSDPKDYDGGYLRIHAQGTLHDVKLPAGSVILYPSDTLHEITPVTKGERCVIVGWIQSTVRDTQIRNILSDLANVNDELSNIHDNSDTYTSIQEKTIHSFNRLYRLHCDV